LRQLRLAAPAQLALGIIDRVLEPAEQWMMLPAEAQATVIAVLSKMISAGVIISEAEEIPR
jgi:6-phosphogluconate dehydrogenase (decarboxylating)